MIGKTKFACINFTEAMTSLSIIDAIKAQVRNVGDKK